MDPRRSVAVVVPCFNAASTLEATLASITAQGAVLEVVVVDDGSTDATVEVAQRCALADQRITLVVQANAGPVAARMAGAARTTAPLLVFCDADDVLTDGALDRAVLALEGMASAVGVVSGFTCIDPSGGAVDAGSYPRWVVEPQRPKGLTMVPSARRDFAAGMTRLCFPPPAGVLVRRDRFEEVGGFDPLVERSEDVECWLRMAQLGDFASVAEPGFAYRIHPRQRSKTAGRALGAVKVRRTMLAKCLRRRDIVAGWQGTVAFYLDLAHQRLRAGWRSRSVRTVGQAVVNLGVCAYVTVAALEALSTPDARRRARFNGGLGAR